jgi:hypothetical protein
MRFRVNATFKNPQGATVTDWIYFNRDREKQWVAYSAWIGSKPSGDIEMMGLEQAVYMKEGNSVVGIVRGIGTDSCFTKIGDTGTGRLYAGSIPYPSPIDFTWECVQTEFSEVLTQSATPNQTGTRPPSPSNTPPDTAYLRPFRRP